jgi:4-hydroxythreonine-4-phosphate dehydrogenase
MGDPAGIGPEIIVKACVALRDRIESGQLNLLVVGSFAAWAQARLGAGGAAELPPLTRFADRAALTGAPCRGLGFLQATEEQGAVPLGEVSVAAGRFAYYAVEQAVRLAEAGAIDAIVTAPLNKEALNLAGFHFAGHTEMLAELTGQRGSVMLLVHGNMRVSHVTTHIALEDVPQRVTPERLRRVIGLTHEALQALDIARPRIAVAALNPHAGEGGLFGRQDIDVVAPTIAACVRDGMAVSGPVPGDTVFVKLRAGSYDAVVAMYHDQGHIPVKLLGFHVDPASGAWTSLSGVNVTLGLPIIRTSVDHGTAFDIAGRGIASEVSLIEAIDLAIQLAQGRRPAH